MSGNDVRLHCVLVSVLLSFLLLGLVSNAAGGPVFLLLSIVLPALFIAGGVSPLPSRVYLVSFLLFLAFVFFMSIRIRAMVNPKLCFLQSQIVHIEGRVVYDSSMTSNGNHMMKIMLSGCSSVLGDHGSASGLVSVLGDQSEIISSGTLVRLEGKFYDSLFIYERIQVVGRGRLNAVREYLIPRLEMRLASGDEASSLSTMLLFGRLDFGESHIRDLALGCGCSHILALSGMHLGIIASMCRRVFGDGWIGKAASFFLVALFVFIAGPRPSLVRAAISFALGLIGIERRAFPVLVIQMILFPVSMVEVGCCYGYVAVFAIAYLYPFIEAALYQFLGRPVRLFCATISVLVLSAPVQMVLNGSWHPAAVLASPLAASLAAASMAVGYLLLIFGQVPILMKANSLIFMAMEKLFVVFGAFPSFGWFGYLVFLVVLSIPFGLLALSRNQLAKR